MSLKRFLLLSVTLLFTSHTYSQTSTATTGWFAAFYTQKINNKFGMHLDAQLRSADKFDYLRTYLIRPAVTYKLNNNFGVALGYFFSSSDIKTGNLNLNQTENRIWQQVTYKHPLGKYTLNHRVRYEQRFMEDLAGDDFFTQRFRYYVRTILPLKNQEKIFKEGLYVGLQNEIFLTTHNKKELNNSVFDQNRAYAGLGYRTKAKIDLELGYINQIIKGEYNNSVVSIFQLSTYARF